MTDKDALRRQRINPRAVGLTLVRLFAEMTLIHGYVHADPHPGNVMVRAKGAWVGERAGRSRRMYPTIVPGGGLVLQGWLGGELYLMICWLGGGAFLNDM